MSQGELFRKDELTQTSEKKGVDRPIMTAFMLVGELAQLEEATPFNKHEKMWRRELPPYTIYVNGHGTVLKTYESPHWDIDPYHLGVIYSGWLFALIHPYGGIMGVGGDIGEDHFIETVEKEIKRIKDGQSKDI